jgi:hypothetical protein
MARRHPRPHRRPSGKQARGIDALELGAATQSPGRLTLHTNKVHHVYTITRVAGDLGEDETWLADIALGMDPEDGVIWVYDLSDDGVMAFTDFGIENLRELIAIHRDIAQ